ncbi:MAG: 16S rRNA (guanine(527)-N(7))-methyltransferase RsmG, partial [Fretibacterium sp.]
MDAECLRNDEMPGAAVEPLERQWHEPLYRYAELLSGCISARLTGTRGTEELYDLHVRDCLESVPLLPASGSVVDVGSGGGLPGVVWAICRPDLRVVLLDSVAKKCRAVGEIVRALGLRNVELLCERSEDTARARRETFALAAARALARAGIAAEYLSPLVAVGGRLLAFKGPKVGE